jgi:hypothetical protein
VSAFLRIDKFGQPFQLLPGMSWGQLCHAHLIRSSAIPKVQALLITTSTHHMHHYQGIGDLIAAPEGPSFISSTVARRRVDRRHS